MKKFFMALLTVLSCIGLASCKIVTDIFDSTTNTKLKNVKETAYLNLNPTLEGYRKFNVVGGVEKYYYFNIGSYDGLPITTTESYFHDGDAKNYEYTINNKSQTNFKSLLNDALVNSVDMTERRDMDLSINKVKDPLTNKYDVIVRFGKPGTLGTDNEFLYSKSETNNAITENIDINYHNIQSIIKTYDENGKTNYEFLEDGINTSKFKEPFSTYKNSKLYNTKKSKYLFKASDPKGYYRFGVYCKCDVFAVVVLNTNTNKYCVEYRLLPAEDSIYYGIQYNTINDFKARFDRKIYLNYSSIRDALKFDYNSKLGEKIKITFNSLGGSHVTTQTLLYGEFVSKPTDPKKAGYIFDGWYLDQNFNEKFDFTTAPTKDITLYAKWDKDPNIPDKVEVTFVTNGGSSISKQVLNYGDCVDLKVTTTKSGYKFIGWYTDSKLQNKYNNNPVTENITLYAKWEKVEENNMCTVTFVTNCNTPLGPVTVNKGEKLNVNINISNSGYVPGGLYYDSTFTRKFNYEDTINSDITLYFKWVKITSSFNPSALTTETYNVKCLSNNKIEVDVKFINNTGSTINALNDVLFTIKVDNIVRTNAYFSKLDLGPLYNGSSKIWTLVIHLSPEEYNWFKKQPSGFRYQYDLICSFDVR